MDGVWLWAAFLSFCGGVHGIWLHFDVLLYLLLLLLGGFLGFGFLLSQFDLISEEFSICKCGELLRKFNIFWVTAFPIAIPVESFSFAERGRLFEHGEGLGCVDASLLMLADLELRVIAVCCYSLGSSPPGVELCLCFWFLLWSHTAVVGAFGRDVGWVFVERGSGFWWHLLGFY